MAINMTFTDYNTIIPSDWLNNVNTAVNTTLPGIPAQLAVLTAKAVISLTDYGCKCNGTTNDTTAVLAAITAIGSSKVTLVVPGPTLISGNVTFAPNTILSIPHQGGFVGVAGTEQVYAQAQIDAGAYQIFTNCAPLTSIAQFIYPEWFGAAVGGTDTVNLAAFQAASNYLQFTGGTIQAGFGIYPISANFNIGTQTGSVGQNIRFQGRGENITTFNLTNANNGFLQVLGASASTLQGINLKDFSITKTPAPTGGVGIFLQYTALAKLSNIHVSGMLQGIGLLGAGNTILDDILVNITGSANNCDGYDINGGGANVGGNASSVFNRCYVDASQSTGTGHIGFKSYGAYVSDLQFIACETADAPSGYYFDMTASANAGNEDVHLINCRADSVSVNAVFVNGAGSVGSADSMVSIIGGWFNCKSILAEVDLLFFNNCRGISISGGTQLYAAAGAAFATHVKLANCNNITISNDTIFSEMKYGVYMTSCGYSQIGGRFYSSAGTPATNFVVGSACARVLVTSSTFDGFCAGNVVNFDSSSVGCGILTSTLNAATLTNTPRILNSSASPIGSSDGSTGLNSGV